MNWIMLLFYLEVGFLPNNSWLAYDIETTQYEIFMQECPSLYSELNAEIELADVLFVGGAVRTDMWPTTLVSHNPYWVTFDFNAGFRVKGLELGFRHTCTHPIEIYSALAMSREPLLEGAYEEIYLRIKGSSHPGKN